MKNQFEVLDRLEEAEEETDTRVWLREFAAIHRCRPARERAYKIVKMYFEVGEMPPDTHHGFIAWLMNGYESEAKKWALEQVLEEIAGQ